MDSHVDDPRTPMPGGPGSEPHLPDAEKEDQPIRGRLERDPANIGGEIADQGDLVFPMPEPEVPHL